jgi:hypothetical protein
MIVRLQTGLIRVKTCKAEAIRAQTRSVASGGGKDATPIHRCLRHSKGIDFQIASWYLLLHESPAARPDLPSFPRSC